MCFVEKRYDTCAFVGHSVDGPGCYDRKACDEAKRQGEIGLCDEVHTKYKPAFISPFCELCTRSEDRLRHHFREALLESLSAGQLCRPVLTKQLLDKVLENIKTPERAPRVSLDELTTALDAHRNCASAWLDREVKLPVSTVGMTVMAELFASWLTQALKAKLIDAAIKTKEECSFSRC